MTFLLSSGSDSPFHQQPIFQKIKFDTGSSYAFKESPQVCALMDENQRFVDIWESLPWIVLLQGHVFLTTQTAKSPTMPLRASDLLELYLAHSVSLGEMLRGSYSVTLIHIDSGEIYCASDAFASHPLYYFQQDRNLLISSSARLIKRITGNLTPICAQSLFDYFFFHVIPHPFTAFKQIYRLAPNQYLHFKDQKLTRKEIKLYTQVQREKNSKSVQSRLKQTLEDSTDRILSIDAKAGCFLSGGLDSSTVAGLLAAKQPQTQAFTIGFNAEGYDEVSFARQSAEHFDLSLITQYVTPDEVVNFVPEFAAQCELPFGNASAVPTFYCAQLAKSHGMRTLLGGDGGDELFAGNDRYLKQQLLWQYDKIPSALRSGVFNPLSHILPYVGLRKVRRYIQQAMIPLPARLQSYNLLYQLGIENIFEPDFLNQIDPNRPIELMQARYSACPDPNPLERILFTDLQFTLADSDIPKVVSMCQMAGIDVQFPFLDEDVLQYARTVHPGMKMKNRDLRHFYKTSLRDWLPPHTLTKSKHGFGLPFGVWMVENQQLRELAGANLESFRQRNILQGAFLDKLENEHLIQHPAYFGTLVWLILILETWLQENPN